MLVTLTITPIDRRESIITWTYEDIAHIISMNETELRMMDNHGFETIVYLRSNDSVGTDDWAEIVITCTRKAMKFG